MADGRQFLQKAIHVGLVAVGVVAREEDGSAGQRGFHGVTGGDGFAFFRGWSGAFLGVAPVGFEFCFGEVRLRIWHGDRECSGGC
jgi:hypothetical protein